MALVLSANAYIYKLRLSNDKLLPLDVHRVLHLFRALKFLSSTLIYALVI
jgi:hypothetical protein